MVHQSHGRPRGIAQGAIAGQQVAIRRSQSGIVVFEVENA